jgi:quercetin dioxygenase-like cupin family protein
MARQQALQLAFMFACPLLCGVLPLLVAPLLWRAASVHSAYPVCHDALAASGAPYVRPFAAPSDFGRPGLSHVTVHGAVRHGARELEVWQQAFAPGVGTPIHRHDCEEVFVVLAGAGTLFTRESGGSATPLRFGANVTLVVPPNAVHQARVCAAMRDALVLTGAFCVPAGAEHGHRAAPDDGHHLSAADPRVRVRQLEHARRRSGAARAVPVRRRLRARCRECGRGSAAG